MSKTQFYIVDKEKIDSLLSSINGDKALPEIEDIKELLHKSIIMLSKPSLLGVGIDDIDQFLDHFCRRYEIRKETMRSRDRNSAIVELRKNFFFQAKQRGFNNSDIAKALNRHHSTLSYYLTLRNRNVSSNQRR